MAWLTQTDIERLITALQLTRFTDDTNEPATTVDTDIVTDVISEVTDEVKAELSSRYASACASETASPMITGICKALAMLKLVARRSDFALTNAQVMMIEQAQDKLRRLRDGELSISGTGWGAESGIEYANPQFSDDSPEDFVDWINSRDEVDLG